MAQTYADCGVRVNCVLPRPIDTPLLQNSFLDESAKERCASRIPMRRIGSPEDVANMVDFLVSENAEFITGGAFPVDVESLLPVYILNSVIISLDTLS